MSKIKILTPHLLEELIDLGPAERINDTVYLASRYESVRLDKRCACEGTWYIPFNLEHLKIRLVQLPTGITLKEFLDNYRDR